jgi:hypothetical protein
MRCVQGVGIDYVKNSLGGCFGMHYPVKLLMDPLGIKFLDCSCNNCIAVALTSSSNVLSGPLVLYEGFQTHGSHIVCMHICKYISGAWSVVGGSWPLHHMVTDIT